jgi:hypothetical protein
MSLTTLRDTLLWCALINFGLLAVWGLMFLLPHGGLYRLSARVSRLPSEQFDAVNYAGIVLYKIGIILFNLVPYLALCIAG